MMALERVQYYRVTSRPNLFMGADREMIMFSGVISASTIFAMQTFESIVFGVLFWLFAAFCLRLMAKHDPLMRHIFLKDMKYANYFAPHSTWSYANSNFQETFYKNPDTFYG